MKEVRYSTKAKKDLKHYRNDLAKMKELFHVLQVLASGGDEGTGLQPGGLLLIVIRRLRPRLL